MIYPVPTPTYSNADLSSSPIEVQVMFLIIYGLLIIMGLIFLIDYLMKKI